MSRVPSRVKDKELVDERRRAIVEGATSVFKEKGYPKATVREIAQAARLGTGSIYDYVKSKDDILYLFYENYMNSFYEKLMKSGSKDDDPRNALAAAYRSLIEVCFDLEDQYAGIYTGPYIKTGTSEYPRPRGRDRGYVRRYSRVADCPTTTQALPQTSGFSATFGY
jgi:AcrR family transcriptional regulator